MKKQQGFRSIGLVAAVLVALVPAVLAAQSGEPARPPASTTLAGEVEDVNPLTVEVGEQKYLLATAPNVVTVREGKEVKLGDLKQGDKVNFATGPDGSVSRIDVTDPVAAERNTLLTVGLLLLALLLAAAAIWYLMQRRNRERPVRRTT
jgi:preprotein translocase subunit YajC